MRRANTLLLPALVLVVASLLGARGCGGGPSHKIAFSAPTTVPNATFFSVDVVVTAASAIHAYDFSMKWDPTLLWGFAVDPQPGFDDDAALFLTPSFGFPGRLDGVVDLRHGGAGVSGTFTVARIWFFSLYTPGPATLEFTAGGLATATGSSPVTAAPLSVVMLGP